MSEADVKLLLFQLLAVVKYLHSINVWHRDLKSANVLSTYSQGCRMIKVLGASPLPSPGSLNPLVAPGFGIRVPHKHKRSADGQRFRPLPPPGARREEEKTNETEK